MIRIIFTQVLPAVASGFHRFRLAVSSFGMKIPATFWLLPLARIAKLFFGLFMMSLLSLPSMLG